MNYVMKGQGPVLVLQHGFLSGSAYWQQQIDALSDHFTVVASDLPGFGLNSQLASPDSIGGYVEAVIAGLDQTGINTFSLIGHSMGGMIAQEMALTHPERIEKLVLYCTGPVGELPGRFESISTSRTRISNGGLDETIARTVASWFLHGRDDPSYQAAMELAGRASLQAVLAGFSAMESWQSVARLTQIRAETLVLWADRDRSYPWSQPEQLWKSIPGAALCILPNAAHNLHLEQPALFNHVIRNYLERVS